MDASDIFLALQQLGLVGRAVVVEVALGGRDPAVCHADAFDLAGGGDAGEAFLQRRALALRASWHGTRAHQGFKVMTAGLAVVVKEWHVGLLWTGVQTAKDAGFVPVTANHGSAQ